MRPSTTTCVICHVPLASHRAPAAHLCDNPRCRHAYDRLPKDRLCTVCGRPLEPRDLANRVCAAVACQQAVAPDRAHARAERERRAAEFRREEARALRDQLAADAGVADAASYRPAVIPYFTAPVTNLPDRRRRAFRDGLNRLVSQATAGDDPGPAPEPSPPSPAAAAVLGQACGLCRGDCCRGGGDHAYLTPSAVRRFMTARPDLRPRDVLAAYLDRIGPKTYRGSCVFHRPGGCSLPREMRSDTCNRHFCEGMRAFRQDLPAGPVRGFFVTTADGSVHAAAFIDEAEVRLVRLPAAAVTPGTPAPS